MNVNVEDDLLEVCFYIVISKTNKVTIRQHKSNDSIYKVKLKCSDIIILDFTTCLVGVISITNQITEFIDSCRLYA